MIQQAQQNKFNCVQKCYWKSLFLWTPLLLWYLLAFFFTHNPSFFQKVDIIYYAAAQHWLHALPLYDCKGNGCFVYLPTSAAFFSPLSLLPLKVYEIVFRLISVGFLTVGIYYFSDYIAELNQKRVFFFTLLISVILSQAALFQGQMHLIITGMIMLGCVALAREKGWQAALWFTLSVAIKPTAIVFYLLALVMYRKVSLKILFLSTLFLLLSCVMQSPQYVITQYHSFVQNFQTNMQFDALHGDNWATLFGAVAFYTHHTINGSIQFIIRIFAALCVLGLCFFAKFKFSQRDSIYFIFSLGMCYLMLFNSRTENTDYVMIAPVIGYSLALAVNYKKKWEIIALSVCVCLIALNWQLSHFISPQNNVWLNPTVVLLYTVYLICQFGTGFRRDVDLSCL